MTFVVIDEEAFVDEADDESETGEDDAANTGANERRVVFVFGDDADAGPDKDAAVDDVGARSFVCFVVVCVGIYVN